MTLYSGSLVDGHMHLWDLEDPPFNKTFWPWLKGSNQAETHFGGTKHQFDTETRRTYLVEDYIKDTQGHSVVKSVHVEAECSDPRLETQWLQAVADKHGFPHGIVAHAKLDAVDVDELLAFHARFPNVRGIRQLITYEEPDLKFSDRGDYLTDPKWVRGYSLLEKHGLSFDFHIFHTQVDDAYNLIKQHPNIQAVIDHTLLPKGYFDPRPEAVEAWKAAVTKLASLPNVAMKLSGMSMTHWHPTADKMRPYVLHVINAFGPDRCFFASNFPVDKMTTTFHNLFQSFKEIVKDFSPEAQKQLFHDTCIKTYRL
eukprot:TRINITY_DN15487_c0_g1_i1.p1 TRINITY_DN15487_c0_g1~~TRINITY_DN15487_c0_g1_i1.p1  ORF type:complete len:312 (-),score=12.03 TRINITY_DN15487_c0_g1_i1:22-957(-)